MHWKGSRVADYAADKLKHQYQNELMVNWNGPVLSKVKNSIKNLSIDILGHIRIEILKLDQASFLQTKLLREFLIA